MISVNSDVNVIVIKDEEILKIFLKEFNKNEIIIGMGAGSISHWMKI